MSQRRRSARRIQETIYRIQKNFECPICLDLMKNPVSTRCDHKFCRHCILETIGKKQKAPCPLCKELFTKRSLQTLPQWNQIVTTVASLVRAFEMDTGVLCSPPRNFSLASPPGTPVSRRKKEENAQPPAIPSISSATSKMAEENKIKHPTKTNTKQTRRKLNVRQVSRSGTSHDLVLSDTEPITEKVVEKKLNPKRETSRATDTKGKPAGEKSHGHGHTSKDSSAMMKNKNEDLVAYLEDGSICGVKPLPGHSNDNDTASDVEETTEATVRTRNASKTDVALKNPARKSKRTKTDHLEPLKIERTKAKVEKEPSKKRKKQILNESSDSPGKDEMCLEQNDIKIKPAVKQKIEKWFNEQETPSSLGPTTIDLSETATCGPSLMDGIESPLVTDIEDEALCLYNTRRGFYGKDPMTEDSEEEMEHHTTEDDEVPGEDGVIVDEIIEEVDGVRLTKRVRRKNEPSPSPSPSRDECRGEVTMKEPSRRQSVKNKTAPQSGWVAGEVYELVPVLFDLSQKAVYQKVGEEEPQGGDENSEIPKKKPRQYEPQESTLKPVTRTYGRKTTPSKARRSVEEASFAQVKTPPKKGPKFFTTRGQKTPKRERVQVVVGPQSPEDPYTFRVSQSSKGKKGKNTRSKAKKKQMGEIELVTVPSRRNGNEIAKRKSPGSDHEAQPDETNNDTSLEQDAESQTELESLVEKISEAEEYELVFSQQVRDMAEQSRMEISADESKGVCMEVEHTEPVMDAVTDGDCDPEIKVNVLNHDESKEDNLDDLEKLGDGTRFNQKMNDENADKGFISELKDRLGAGKDNTQESVSVIGPTQSQEKKTSKSRANFAKEIETETDKPVAEMCEDENENQAEEEQSQEKKTSKSEATVAKEIEPETNKPVAEVCKDENENQTKEETDIEERNTEKKKAGTSRKKKLILEKEKVKLSRSQHPDDWTHVKGMEKDLGPRRRSLKLEISSDSEKKPRRSSRSRRGMQRKETVEDKDLDGEVIIVADDTQEGDEDITELPPEAVGETLAPASTTANTKECVEVPEENRVEAIVSNSTSAVNEDGEPEIVEVRQEVPVETPAPSSNSTATEEDPEAPEESEKKKSKKKQNRKGKAKTGKKENKPLESEPSQKEELTETSCDLLDSSQTKDKTSIDKTTDRKANLEQQNSDELDGLTLNKCQGSSDNHNPDNTEITEDLNPGEITNLKSENKPLIKSEGKTLLKNADQLLDINEVMNDDVSITKKTEENDDACEVNLVEPVVCEIADDAPMEGATLNAMEKEKEKENPPDQTTEAMEKEKEKKENPPDQTTEAMEKENEKENPPDQTTEAMEKEKKKKEDPPDQTTEEHTQPLPGLALDDTGSFELMEMLDSPPRVAKSERKTFSLNPKSPLVKTKADAGGNIEEDNSLQDAAAMMLNSDSLKDDPIIHEGICGYSPNKNSKKKSPGDEGRNTVKDDLVESKKVEKPVIDQLSDQLEDERCQVMESESVKDVIKSLGSPYLITKPSKTPTPKQKSNRKKLKFDSKQESAASPLTLEGYENYDLVIAESSDIIRKDVIPDEIIGFIPDVEGNDNSTLNVADGGHEMMEKSGTTNKGTHRDGDNSELASVMNEDVNKSFDSQSKTSTTKLTRNRKKLKVDVKSRSTADSLMSDREENDVSVIPDSSEIIVKNVLHDEIVECIPKGEENHSMQTDPDSGDRTLMKRTTKLTRNRKKLKVDLKSRSTVDSSILDGEDNDVSVIPDSSEIIGKNVLHEEIVECIPKEEENHSMLTDPDGGDRTLMKRTTKLTRNKKKLKVDLTSRSTADSLISDREDNDVSVIPDSSEITGRNVLHDEIVECIPKEEESHSILTDPDGGELTLMKSSAGMKTSTIQVGDNNELPSLATKDSNKSVGSKALVAEPSNSRTPKLTRNKKKLKVDLRSRSIASSLKSDVDEDDVLVIPESSEVNEKDDEIFEYVPKEEQSGVKDSADVEHELMEIGGTDPSKSKTPKLKKNKKKLKVDIVPRSTASSLMSDEDDNNVSVIPDSCEIIQKDVITEYIPKKKENHSTLDVSADDDGDHIELPDIDLTSEKRTVKVEQADVSVNVAKDAKIKRPHQVENSSQSDSDNGHIKKNLSPRKKSKRFSSRTKEVKQVLSSDESSDEEVGKKATPRTGRRAVRGIAMQQSPNTKAEIAKLIECRTRSQPNRAEKNRSPDKSNENSSTKCNDNSESGTLKTPKKSVQTHPKSLFPESPVEVNSPSKSISKKKRILGASCTKSPLFIVQETPATKTGRKRSVLYKTPKFTSPSLAELSVVAETPVVVQGSFRQHQGEDPKGNTETQDSESIILPPTPISESAKKSRRSTRSGIGRSGSPLIKVSPKKCLMNEIKLEEHDSSSDGQSEEEVVGPRRKSLRNVIEDDISDDEGDIETDSSVASRNLTSSSVYSSQSEQYGTEKVAELKDDVEDLEAEIQIIKARLKAQGADCADLTEHDEDGEEDTEGEHERADYPEEKLEEVAHTGGPTQNEKQTVKDDAVSNVDESLHNMDNGYETMYLDEHLDKSHVSNSLPGTDNLGSETVDPNVGLSQGSLRHRTPIKSQKSVTSSPAPPTPPTPRTLRALKRDIPLDHVDDTSSSFNKNKRNSKCTDSIENAESKLEALKGKGDTSEDDMTKLVYAVGSQPEVPGQNILSGNSADIIPGSLPEKRPSRGKRKSKALSTADESLQNKDNESKTMDIDVHLDKSHVSNSISGTDNLGSETMDPNDGLSQGPLKHETLVKSQKSPTSSPVPPTPPTPKTLQALKCEMTSDNGNLNHLASTLTKYKRNSRSPAEIGHDNIEEIQTGKAMPGKRKRKLDLDGAGGTKSRKLDERCDAPNTPSAARHSENHTDNKALVRLKTPMADRSVMSPLQYKVSPSLSADRSFSGVDVDLPQRPHWCFVLSGIKSMRVKSRIKRFQKLVGAKESNKMISSATHLIVPPGEGSEDPLMCDRTLKYFQAIAARKWIVSSQWVDDCLKIGQLLPEAEYEIYGDMTAGSSHGGPRKSRLNGGQLFKNIEMYCVSDYINITKDQLRDLIELCGGSIVQDPTMFSFDKHYQQLIIAEQHEEEEEDRSYLNKLYKLYGVPIVGKDWVLNSIGQYELERQRDHGISLND